LKAISAANLISLGKLSALKAHHTSAKSEKFELDPNLITSLANPIIKSLLAQVNQERNFTLKKQAVKAVVDLMYVGEHLRMETMCKKTIKVMLDMVHTGEVNQQLKTLIADRDQALALFFRGLIKLNRGTTIFEQFNGYLGA
jgi:hypothetical protein